MKLKFHNLIFIGMALGIVLGIALWSVDDKGKIDTLLWWLDLCGTTLFIGALKMIIAPLILTSVVAGVVSLPNVEELGRIGWKTFAYYVGTTTIAVVIGLVFVLTLQPGKKEASQNIRAQREAELAERKQEFRSKTGRNPDDDGDGRAAYLSWLHEVEGEAQAGGHEAKRWTSVSGAEGRRPRDIFKEDILKPVLTNPFEALSKRVSLGIIFTSILLGIAILVVGEPAQPLADVFKAANHVVMKITNWIMTVSPFAIMCLVASLIAKHGPEVFQSLAWYCGTVLGGIVVHVVVLLLIAHFVGGRTPREIYRGIREAWLIAFSTRSSAATLPVTLKCVTENLKVKPQVADFALPLGATVNMDGTALYEGVAIIYLLQIYGGLVDVPVAMGLVVTILVFVTAVLASVGAAAVPDAGLVTMVLVATAVHLPVYYIPLIFAVDAFLDMFRTSTNVLGDVVGCTVVERFEGERLAAA